MKNNKYSGLTTFEANERLKRFGLNDVAEQKDNFVKKFLEPLYSPMSLMLLGASILSFVDGKIFDFYFIFGLYFVNYIIQKWQEFKADKAIDELREKLSFNVLTLRDNKWININAKQLVPGDIIKLGLGSIIPADAIIISSKNLSINEAVLTGESLPKEKKENDIMYSSSYITSGSVEAEISATGKNTNFGKTIFSIEQRSDKSILEKDVLSITRFLMIISIIAVLILTIVFFLKGSNFEDIMTLDLSLIIAGIPVATPAVMAIILSIGASELAKKMVVIRRLSALQDLANVNLLLTDKTGTLTKNEIQITNIISYQKELSTNDIIKLARYATSSDTPDSIDLAVIKKFEATGLLLPKTKILKFIPYDSERKRSTTIIKNGNEKILISLGAPQIIEDLDGYSSKDVILKFRKDIAKAASGGFRVLAIATKISDEEEKNMRIVGLLLLSDPLDETSKDTISFMKENGINVKMVTGDNIAIAERISKELNLFGRVLSSEETINLYNRKITKKDFKNIATFSEILPKDKYELVRAFKENYIVASTGDGINDLPAIKTANVGIAVSSAVSALKSLADIVLLGRGIAVIKDAIIESRKIFTRIYNYSVYRISESFRLIITILILGIIFGSYPLQPLQLILLAFLNDIPIISLAYDRVKISSKPSEINTKKRIYLSLLFGFVGVINSILLFLITIYIFHFPLPIVQTMFFLKLTVGGHLLVFVAHTEEKWFKFLPSKIVIIATMTTQIIATILAITGFLMPAKISPLLALCVWIWSFFWMQISDLMKYIKNKFK